MRSIIDAHIHVDTHDVCSIQKLVEQMDQHNVRKSVLIVNTQEEFVAVKDDLHTLFANKERFHLVSGVNVHHKDPLAIYNFFSNMGLDSDVKLHPKLFNYTRTDFEEIFSVVENLKVKNIVIDTLYFGEQVENHIGTELGIFLAQRLPQKRIVLAHAGSVRLLECQMYTRNLTNIVYDLSFTASYLNHTSVRYDMINFLKYTSNRIMFGTDYPSFDMERAINCLTELGVQAGLSEQGMNRVFYQNAQEIYNIG